VAAFAYATSSGCGGNTFTAKTSENDTLPLISSVTQSYGCLVMFKIDSLVHTNASEVITFGGITTGPPAYISTGVMQFSNAGGGIDNSQTCSGTGFASPLSCSSVLTPTQTNDMAVAAYGEYACNGNVVSSTTLTVPIGGCPAGGNQSGYLVAFGMGYSLLSTTSAFTPSFTDSNVAGNVNEILGTILK
jgi:hypothetical protein